MENVYLDNASTTRPYDSVVDKMADIALVNYANPSSLHLLGQKAESVVTDARKVVADALGCRTDEIYFTSGGTESDNIAISGYAYGARRRGMHIITTKIEHPAVIKTTKRLSDEGFSIDYAKVDKDGVVDLEHFKSLIRSDTILASIMFVNNEVGSIQPILKIKSILKERAPKAVLHTDAVQAFGKMEVIPSEIGADMVSVSAHKIHGPKGIGALYVKKGLKINPILSGGGQEKNIRSGTENVPAIAGFAEAVKISIKNIKENGEKIRGLKEKLKDLITKNITDIYFNASSGLGYILSVSFEGAKSEVLLHALESKGIFVSTGSACSSRHPSPSETLTAMGIDKKLIDSTIRFSFSEFNTEEEIVYCANVLVREVEKIRRYTGR